MVLVSYLDLKCSKTTQFMSLILAVVFVVALFTGSDMLSLGLPPLHVAPFFLYKVRKIW